VAINLDPDSESNISTAYDNIINALDNNELTVGMNLDGKDDMLANFNQILNSMTDDAEEAGRIASESLGLDCDIEEVSAENTTT